MHVRVPPQSMPDMVVMLETTYAGHEQSFIATTSYDVAVMSACPDEDVTSPDMTSRDYFSQIRQLRQQL